MPLLLVQCFVNTREADTGVDLLGDMTTARSWLREAELVGRGSFSQADLAQVREVRESLRALLVHNAGGPPPTVAELWPLTAVAEACRLRSVVLDAGRIELEPESTPGLAPLAKLLLVVRDAQRDGSWERLKACRNDECLWAFYDRSHAIRGAWCDMASCGNRIKNRNLRSRRSSVA
jgi:predicted RNA-binding Zn ribbon-like protein